MTLETDGQKGSPDANGTPPEPRIIAIVGMAGSSAKEANGQPENVEIWGSGTSYAVLTKKPTRWFETHSPAAWRGPGASLRAGLRDPGRYGWLQRADFPIYMLEKYDDVPTSIPYPAEDMANETFPWWWVHYQGENERWELEPYLTSGPAWALAMAVHERPDEIRIFGIDMVGDGEYAHQRACLELYIGQARGMGIKVTIPAVSPLGKDPLYGGPREFTQATLEQYRTSLVNERDRVTASYNFLNGQISATDYWLQAFGKNSLMNPIAIKALNDPQLTHEWFLAAGTPRGKGGMNVPVVTGE